MKLLNIIALSVLITSPVMAADFNYPLPPQRPFTFNPKTYDNYITAFGGSNLNQSGYTLGGNIGTKIYGPFTGEVSYIFRDPLNKTANHRVMGNVLYNVPVYYGTVYALVGAGYNVGDYKTPLWNVGAGYDFPINNKWSVDTRYTFTSRFDTRKVNDQTIVSGVKYKF